MVAQMPNRLEGPRRPSLRGATAFLLVCAAGSVGCENTDPCVLRQAACIDVLLIGGVSKQGDALVYRDLSIKVNDANGKEILPAQTFPLLTDTSEKDVGIPRRPTGSGVYGRVTIKLPDSFNALMDRGEAKDVYPADPCSVSDATSPDWSAALDELRPLQAQKRSEDPRRVQIVVQAKEDRVDRGVKRDVGWDSRVFEDICFSPSQICNDLDGWGYYRVGLNQHINAFVYLEPPPSPDDIVMKRCPMSGTSK